MRRSNEAPSKDVDARVAAYFGITGLLDKDARGCLLAVTPLARASSRLRVATRGVVAAQGHHATPGSMSQPIRSLSRRTASDAATTVIDRSPGWPRNSRMPTMST